PSCRTMKAWRHQNLYPLFPLPRLDKNKGEDAEKALNEILDVKSADPYAPIKVVGTGRILIDQIRELRDRLSLTTNESGVRVIVIHPAERMNDQASNALMKTLEEPPEQCCFILTTPSTRDMFPTIVSRCQILTFSPLSVDEITSALMNRLSAPEGQARAAALISDGNYTQAVGLVGEETLTKLMDGLEFLRMAAVKNNPQIAAMVDKWLKDGSRVDTASRLKYIAIWLKDAMIWRAFGRRGVDGHLSTFGREQVIERLAARYSLQSLELIYRELEEAVLAIDANVNIQLVLIALAVKMKRAFSQ
ncbi:MAG: hypothetical protein P9M15_07350, partial [Candidatus Electryoneaceae bacterium]|nr:hypothetical protein [Candidatus Electryoneaceae bacterium]